MEVKGINYAFFCFVSVMLKTFISLCTQQSSFTLNKKIQQNNIWYIVTFIHTHIYGINSKPLFFHQSHSVSCLISNITIIIKFYQRKIIVFASRPYQSNYILQPILYINNRYFYR